MLNETLNKALNDQLNAEYYSSYLYLAMAAYCEAQALPGFANWFRVQAQEELGHAMRFFDYIVSRGGRVILGAIEKPTEEWESPRAAFEAAYEHEQYITKRINDLVELAAKERDHATTSFLQWFVDEQVEEEASVDAIVQKLKLGGDHPSVLLFLDAELARRQPGPDSGSPSEGE